MRWLVGILLLANLVIFLWGYSRTPTPQITRAPAPDVPNLQLLREVSPTTDGQLASAGGDGGTTRAIALAAAPLPESPRPTHQPPPEVQPAKQPERPLRPTAPGPRIEKATAAEAVAATESPETAREVVPPLPPTTVEKAPRPAPLLLQCGRLGPFSTREAADEARAGLEGLGGEADVVKSEIRQPAGYWVLIPPLPDREAGKITVEKLKAAGISDIWLLAKGSMRNAISLGQFGSESNARRRAETVRAAGFEVEVRQKTRRVPRYWLDFKAPGDVALLSALGPLPEGVQVENQSCR